MKTATLQRPNGSPGSYGKWLAAEASRWFSASDDERTASQRAARERHADLNKARPKAQTGSATVVLVYDEIGFWGITAADLVADLQTVSGDLELHLNTPGGDVFDGIAIANALKQRIQQGAPGGFPFIGPPGPGGPVRPGGPGPPGRTAVAGTPARRGRPAGPG